MLVYYWKLYTRKQISDLDNLINLSKLRWNVAECKNYRTFVFRYDSYFLLVSYFLEEMLGWGLVV